MVPRVRFLVSEGMVELFFSRLEKVREYEPPIPGPDGFFYVVTAYKLDKGMLFGISNGAVYYFDPDKQY
jgi:hypothetical protein